MRTAREMAQAEAERAGVDPALFMRLVTQESTWDPTARSHAGAYGLTQAMPDTWRQPGFGVTPGGDINDPQEQLRFGADYLAAMQARYPGDNPRALAAYNWGAGNADDWNGNTNSLPGETRKYLDIVGGQGSGSGGNSPMASFGGGGGDATILGSAGSDQMLGAPDPEARGTEFHPGLALQGLGAAIAAGSRGESSASDLAVIRKNYFAQQNYQQEQDLAARQQSAGRELFKDDPEMTAALDAGLDLGVAMQIRNQRAQFAQQMALQTNDQTFTAAQGVLKRAHEMDQFGSLSANQQANLELASTKIDNQVSQFGQSFGQDAQIWADKTDQMALEHAFNVSKFDQNTQAGEAAADFENLKFQEQLRAAAFSEDSQTVASAEARATSIRDFEESKRRFKIDHGVTMDNFALETEKVNNQVSQFAQTLNLDSDQLAATITQHSTDHALRVAKFDVSTDEGLRSAALADLQFQETLAQNLISNGLDQGRADQLKAQFNENIRQFEKDFSLSYDQLDQAGEIAMSAAQTTQMKNAIFMSNPNVSDTVKLAYMQNQNSQRNVTSAADQSNLKARELALTADSKIVGDQVAEVNKNRRIQTVLQEYQAILASMPEGSLRQGKLNDLMMGAEKILTNIGVDIEGATERERIVALHAEVFPGLKPDGAGSTSDWEGTVYSMAFPGVGNSPEAFAAQTNYHSKRLDREAAYSSYLQNNYTGQDGQRLIDVISDWQDKVNNGDADTIPMYVNLDTFDKNSDPENPTNNIGQLELGQIVFYKDEAVPVSQRMLDAFNNN